MNGNNIGFHLQTQKLELHTKYGTMWKYCWRGSFEWTHNKNASTESKIRTSNKINSTSEITHEEVSFEWLHNKISSHNQKLELQAK